MKEYDNNIKTLLNEFNNIIVDIKVKGTWSHDLDNPLIVEDLDTPIIKLNEDSDLAVTVEFPKIWDFILSFNRDFTVESDNPAYLDQNSILAYNKAIGERKLEAYQEIDDFIVSQNSLLKKRNYLSSIKLQFEELLNNYYSLSDDKYSYYFNLLGNNTIVRSISENKKINILFEKKLVDSFLIIQRNTIQALIRFIEEKLQLLSNTENDTSGELKEPKKNTSDQITQIDLSQTISHEILTRSFHFQRKESFERDMIMLFELLKRSDIIPKNTDFRNFCHAFSWKPLLEPLRIKWLVIGKNRLTAKSSLFHFISKLEDHKLIDNKEWSEKNNMPLYHKVSVIFTDKDGNLFTIDGLKSSRHQGLNSDCAKQSEIDKIVAQVAGPVTAILPE